MIEVHASTPRLEEVLGRLNIRNSTAIRVDNLIMFSGMTGVDLATGEVPDGIEAQARMVLQIFADILDDLGLNLDHVVKVNCQLTDVDDFGVWNEVFLDMFDAPYPCRTTTGAPLVVGDIEVEITASIEPRR
ncbi:MAG: RidA family protein [Actinomycetota bacterium]|jgi:2-iminobutanoate/2-iminopropanoate deaminase|nr:RidA family protein [Actinomycetota bacterium]